MGKMGIRAAVGAFLGFWLISGARADSVTVALGTLSDSGGWQASSGSIVAAVAADGGAFAYSPSDAGGQWINLKVAAAAYDAAGIPSGATITGVTLNAKLRTNSDYAPSIATCHLTVEASGQAIQAGTVLSPPAGTSFTLYSKTAADTGAAEWSRTSILAATFGVKLESDWEAESQADCDLATVTITYTVPAPSSAFPREYRGPVFISPAGAVVRNHPWAVWGIRCTYYQPIKSVAVGSNQHYVAFGDPVTGDDATTAMPVGGMTFAPGQTVQLQTANNGVNLLMNLDVNNITAGNVMGFTVGVDLAGVTHLGKSVQNGLASTPYSASTTFVVGNGYTWPCDDVRWPSAGTVELYIDSNDLFSASSAISALTYLGGGGGGGTFLWQRWEMVQGIPGGGGADFDPSGIEGLLSDIIGILSGAPTGPTGPTGPHTSPDWVIPEDEAANRINPLLDKRQLFTPSNGMGEPSHVSSPFRWSIPLSSVSGGFGYPALDDVVIEPDFGAFDSIRLFLKAAFIAGTTIFCMGRVWSELRKY